MQRERRDDAPALSAPHAHLAVRDERDRFTAALLDALWVRYRQRVAYVQAYEQVVAAAGATFVNDHIAFRTIATSRPMAGIATLGRVLAALGYQAAGCYQFPDKQLAAVHFEHPVPGFPKLFVSELELWQFPRREARLIRRAVRDQRRPLSDGALWDLAHINDLGDGARQKLLRRVLRLFHRLPWGVPSRKDLLAINETSQYAAWVLAHGYNANHFTALVNSHGTPSLDDIEKTADALRAAGVPMKHQIEGAPGSKLRQTATEAVTIDVPVRQRGRRTTMPWSYAYFELAQRGEVIDPATGQTTRFEGFLGPQATHLFEMTRVKPA